MKSLLPSALHYALDFGWPVHPVNINKKPTTEHGFYDATTDEAKIHEHFKNGAQLSVRTGAKSGLFMLDLDEDTEKGYSVDRTLAMLVERYGELPQTPHQRTGRGGLQYFFKYQEGLKNKAGTLLGPGLDTRGEGGYTVVAPSRNTKGTYEWIVSPDDAPLANVPQWLIDLLRKDDKLGIGTSSTPTGDHDRYVAAALASEIGALATARNGTRNDSLNRASFNLGQFVGASLLNRDHVEQLLRNVASSIGLGAHEIEATIKSGIESGMNKPREIPERSAPDLKLPLVKKKAIKEASEEPVGTAHLPHDFIFACLQQGEAGDAQLLEALYRGKLCYDYAASAWYTFEPHAWTRYDGSPRRVVWSRVAAAYLTLAATIQADLDKETDDTKKKTMLGWVDALTDRAKKLRSLGRINNVLTLAQELLGIKGDDP